MRDFQSYLKYVVESEAPPADDGAAPGTSIEAAATPIQAYMAYRRELNGLMGKVQNVLGKAEQQIEALHGKIGGYLDTAKTKDQIAAQSAALTPQKARPTINRNKVASMVDKYAPPAPATTNPPTA